VSLEKVTRLLCERMGERTSGEMGTASSDWSASLLSQFESKFLVGLMVAREASANAEASS
jgi:hypothetical protein